MREFKIGDKVRCIESNGSSGYLKLNKVYTISAINIQNLYVSLEEIPISGDDVPWSARRFIIIENESIIAPEYCF